MRFIAIIVVTLACFFCRSTYAIDEGPNAKELAEACDQSSGEKRMYCIGVMEGVGMSMYLEEQRNHTCLVDPKSHAYERVEVVFTRWFKAHPENWRLYAPEAIQQSLLESYPCPKDAD